jgi:hypothetical protein
MAVGALAVPLSGCGAGGGAATTTSTTGTPDWRDKIVATPLHDAAPSEHALAAMGQANGVVDGHEDVWALNHYTDEGGVAVNLTADWEAILSEQIAELNATAPAPVEVRVVDHSHTELMATALAPTAHEADFEGASMISAFVEPEWNTLIVQLTEVDQDSIEAAMSVFGDNAVFAKGEPAEATG